MRSLREFAAAALAAVLLVGCAGVPTSGPVREHDAGQEELDSSVRVAPVPPVADASPMLVVEGFLHAMGTDQPGFPVARQYLTIAANRAWRPETGTLIYADGDQPKETENSTPEQPDISFGATLSGALSPAGEYSRASGGLRHDFGLVRTADDQWRISRPPDGLLVSRYHFTTNYSALDLHFADPAGTALVPDPRFFPQGASLAHTLVEAQFAGPGEWLAPAVRDETWQGLSAQRVEVSTQGVVTVYLSPAAARLSDAQRHLLMSELTATLTQLPQVDGVQVSVGATLLPLPGTTRTTLTADDFADLAPAGQQTAGRLLIAREGRIRLVETAQPWAEGDPVAPALTEAGLIAARTDLAEAATVNPEATRLQVAKLRGEEAVTLLEGNHLLRPDYSRNHELWAIANSAAADGFRVFAPGSRAAIEVSAADLPLETVRAFRISPDGSRIALVIDGPEAEQVGVARIVRSGKGIRLEAFRVVEVSPPAGAGRRLVDVGWTTATELLVLVTQGTTASVVRVDQDSARADDIGPAAVVGLRELAVVPGRQAVLRGTATVFRYEGDFNWKLTPSSVDAVAYSG